MYLFPVVCKRLFDILLALLLLGVLWPLLGGIALAIHLSMGSPVLFRQMRPGLGGKPFYLYKFRTMQLTKTGQDMVSSDAIRLTTLGKLLRHSSLDELPELWNILKGEMSFVGPRPLLMQYLERYNSIQSRRHDVLPGLTGWAQVNGRNALSWEKRFELDVWYVDHRSVFLDLKIIAMTVLQVITGKGVSAEGMATMSEFGKEKL